MALDDPLVFKPPGLRAAYSDRTAWLMAMLSELAYEHYEREAWDVEGLAFALAQLSDPATIAGHLQEYREQVCRPLGQGLLAFEEKLRPGGFRLVAIFDRNGTQGFLAVREQDRSGVLAFRGTEKNMTDIWADVRAWQDRGGAHRGFRIAYDAVKDEVVEALRGISDCQLYLTGHSLGGALAMMAAHHLSRTERIQISDQIAACYTFGGPKIGNREFSAVIKPPIYRVVHAADVVPWVPINLAQLLAVLAWIGRILPSRRVSDALHRWLARYFNHVHHGDVRWLEGGDEPNDIPELIQNPGVIEQLLRIVPRAILSWQRLFEDHRIGDYCRKLGAYARYRN